MNRAATALLLLAACGSKKAKEPPADPVKQAPAVGSGSSAGSGSGPGSSATPVAAVELRWTSPEGDLLLALRANGTLEGPCGPVGGVTANDVVIDGQKFAWTGVDRKGRAYQIAPLPWTIQVADSGDITLVNPGKPVVPLGTVTGTGSEDGAKWFAALVIAAPALQIKLGFATPDGKVTYALSASADMAAWTIKQGATIVAKKLRDQPHGIVVAEPVAGVEAKAITVTADAEHTFDVKISGPQTAYGAAAYRVTEADDGALRWKPDAAKAALPLGALTGRAACKAHDTAAAALIETLLSTTAGWTATREADQSWSGKK